jgi:hypothetical protein
MNFFLPGLGKFESKGSLDSLISLQARMCDQQSTGLIQVWFNETRQIILVYAHGILAGSYGVEAGISKPIQYADLTSVWSGAGATSIQCIDSSGKFGRMAWLALESSVEAASNVRDEAGWRQQLQEWKKLNFNGLVEAATKNGQGYVFIANGTPIASESAFLGTLNREQSGSPAFQDGQAINQRTFAPAVGSHAYQCFVLRQSGIKWGNGILTRFQNVAGQKFSQVVCKAIMTLIQPWQWQITVNEQTICDEHFFPRAEALANAYRTIFMGMGTQMGFVIGNNLTSRILTEMYEELGKDDRAVLASYRLIPAAFSE